MEFPSTIFRTPGYCSLVFHCCLSLPLQLDRAKHVPLVLVPAQPLQYVKRKRFQLLWVTHPQQLEAVAVGQHPASGTYSYGRITYIKCSVCCTFLFCDTTGSACGRTIYSLLKSRGGSSCGPQMLHPHGPEFPAIVGAEKIQLRHGGGSVRQLEAPWRDHAMDESTRLITSNHVLTQSYPIITLRPCHVKRFLSLSGVRLDLIIGFTTKLKKLSPLSAQVTKREKLKNAEPQPCGTAWNCRSNMFSDHPKHDLSRVAAVVFYGIS